jgi:hypothetical protein
MQEKIEAMHNAASDGNLKLLQTLAKKKLITAKVFSPILDGVRTCYDVQ